MCIENIMGQTEDSLCFFLNIFRNWKGIKVVGLLCPFCIPKNRRSRKEVGIYA